MTNRASAERELLIHQHQAGTRVLRLVAIPHSGPHYIPDVSSAPPETPVGPWSRDTGQIAVEWRLWASKEIYRRFVIAGLPRSCPSATERSYFTRRFSAYSLIHALSHVYLSASDFLNDFTILLKMDSSVIGISVYRFYRKLTEIY